MGKPAATVGDFHVCPKSDGPKAHVGGPCLGGSSNVLIGGRPALRKGDKAVCIGPPDTISGGAATVFINGKPAVRLGDGTRHGGRIVIGNPTVTIGDGEGDKPIAASTSLKHIPPAPASFDEALQRLDKAADKIAAAEAKGEPAPRSPYSTADKVKLVEDGLQERYIVRIVESKRAVDGNTLGPPGSPATYWTTTYTQIEHADHDAEKICQAVGKDYDPNADYTLLLIDQQAASEQGTMVSFIPTYEALGAFMASTATTDKDLAPVKDQIPAAMSPAYSYYYEHLHNTAAKKKVNLDEADDRNKLAKDLGFDDEQIELLGVRHTLKRKFGANDQFLGNGLTNDATADNPNTPFGPAQSDREYGIAEVFTYDKNPETQGVLTQKGLLRRVPLKKGPSHA